MATRFYAAGLLAGLLWLTSVSAEEEKLVFSTIEESPLAAIASEIMTEAYNRIGQPIEIYYTAGSRALVLSSAGHVDGELVRIGAVKDRFPTLHQVPVPSMEAKGLVFIRQTDRDSLADTDLSKMRVGILNGVVQAERFTDGFEDVWRGHSVEELFQMLAKGKLDAVVSDFFDGTLTIARLGLGGIEPLGDPFEVEPMFHYIHDKNKYLVPIIADVLARMHKAGEIDSITAKVMDTMIADNQGRLPK